MKKGTDFHNFGIKYNVGYTSMEKIGIRSGIYFQNIDIRNGYFFEASMAHPRPKSGQVHLTGGTAVGIVGHWSRAPKALQKRKKFPLHCQEVSLELNGKSFLEESLPPPKFEIVPTALILQIYSHYLYFIYSIIIKY